MEEEDEAPLDINIDEVAITSKKPVKDEKKEEGSKQEGETNSKDA